MAKKSAPAPKLLRITLVRSPIGYPKRQKATVPRLGFIPHAPDRGA